MINEENNYPMRYALMEFYKPNGWDYYGSRTYEMTYYLPVPCYLIKESKVYQSDGTYEMEYEVVFTKSKTEIDFADSNNYPEINFSNGQCSNSQIVETIYDNYEAAKEAAEKANEDYITRFATRYPAETFLEKIEELMLEVENKYAIIEEEIPSKQKVLK